MCTYVFLREEKVYTCRVGEWRKEGGEKRGGGEKGLREEGKEEGEGRVFVREANGKQQNKACEERGTYYMHESFSKFYALTGSKLRSMLSS